MTTARSQGVDTGSRGLWALIVAILVGVLATAFEAYGALTAMPSAAEQFGRLDLYDWAFTIFTMSQVLAIVIAGRACDRHGTVWALGYGFVIFCLGLLGAGLAPSMHFLLGARGVQGFGAGTLNVALMVLIGRVFPDERRPSLMSAFSFCWVLPSFIGPPIAAVVTTRFGWHWVFWGLIPVMVIALILGARPLAQVRHLAGPDHSDPSGEQVQKASPIWAAALVALGAACVQYAGHRLDMLGLGVALIGIAAMAVALRVLMPRGFLRWRRGLSSVMWVRGLQTGAFMASETYLLLVLTQAHAMDLHRASLVLCTGSITWAVASWVQARPWFRLRRDQIIIVGALLTVIGIIVMIVSVWFIQLPVFVVIVGYGLAGFGMGLQVTSTSLAVMTLTPRARLGRATSSLQVAEGLGNSLVLGMAGSVYAGLLGTHDWSTIFTIVLVVPLLSACGGLIASNRIGSVRNEVAKIG